MIAFRVAAGVSLALLSLSLSIDAQRIRLQQQELVDEPLPVDEGAKPAPRPAPIPVTRSEARPAPRPAVRPAARPVAKPAAKPPATRDDNRGVFGVFECPEAFGYFEDPRQCDKYWVCEDFIPEEFLCEDGLVFDITKGKGRDPCDSPFTVDCGERLELQEPTFPSKSCPRKNGFFPDPDETVCNSYHTCISGVDHGKTSCSPGLHFNPNTGTCDWPDKIGRAGCLEHKTVLNGFSCPDEEVIDANGIKIPHPLYPNPTNCELFYTCLNGKEPQESACHSGQVFNELRSTCDYPENVPECIDWFKDDPRYADYYEYYDTIEPQPQAQKKVTVA